MSLRRRIIRLEQRQAPGAWVPLIWIAAHGASKKATKQEVARDHPGRRVIVV